MIRVDIDDQIRRIRIPRSFGRIAGVGALALGESVIQDDHAAAAGAERLPTRRTAVSRSTVQDQNIQLPGQPGRDPIHQGRAFGLVIVFEGEDENERATLVDRIAAWLTWKLDVLVLHGRPRNGRATRRKAFRARSRGMIVLYDGFPERQSPDTGNAPERARDADPPDLVINIDPDHSPEQALLVAQRALWQEV